MLVVTLVVLFLNFRDKGSVIPDFLKGDFPGFGYQQTVIHDNQDWTDIDYESKNVLFCGNSQGDNFNNLNKFYNCISVDIIDNGSIRNRQLTYLEQCEKLENLGLYGFNLSNNGMTHIIQCKKLKKLTYVYYGFKSSMPIANKLTRMCNSVREYHISDEAFVNFSSLKQLECLNLYNCHMLNGSMFIYLKDNVNLQQLELHNLSALQRGSLSTLYNTNINTLSVSYCDPRIFEGLTGIIKLRFFQISHMQFSVDDILWLKNCPELQSIIIKNNFLINEKFIETLYFEVLNNCTFIKRVEFDSCWLNNTQYKIIQKSIKKLNKKGFQFFINGEII